MLTPQPPMDMRVDPLVDHRIVIFMAGLFAIALVFSLLHWARSRRPTVLLMLISGGAMMIFEPMVDTAGGCWFASNSTMAFTAWGRPMPVWLCLTYFAYFGIGVGLIWIAMKNGLTRLQVWAIFGVGMLGDVILEKTLLMFDPYAYYGWQPLLFGKFPLWWAPVNALIPVVTAAAVYRFESRLGGLRQLLIVPIALTISAGVNAAAGWPAWTVINSDVGPLVTQLGGLASFALSFWFADATALWVAKESPVTARTRGFAAVRGNA